MSLTKFLYATKSQNHEKLIMTVTIRKCAEKKM